MTEFFKSTTARGRICHRKKFYSDDGNNSVEVERTDVLITVSGHGPDYKRTISTFRWEDEDDGNNVTREMGTVRVSDPTDASNFVEVPVIKRMTHMISHHKVMGQRHIQTFRNGEDNTKRKSLVKTVSGGVQAEYTQRATTKDGQGVDYELAFNILVNPIEEP